MKIRENLLLKVLAFLLAVAAFAGAGVMAWYQIANGDVIWVGYTPANGSTISFLERQDAGKLRYLTRLYQQEADGVVELDLSQTQYKAELESTLSAENTNLRWQVRDSAGILRYGNTREDVPVPAEGLYLDSVTLDANPYTVELYYGSWQDETEDAVNVTDPDNVLICEDDWPELLAQIVDTTSPESDAIQMDTVFLGADGCTDLLIVTDKEGKHVYGPTVGACQTVNEYGYQYDGGWYQAEEPREATKDLDLILWLADDYPAADKYRQAYETLSGWQSHRGLLLAADIACAVVGLLLAVYLCAGAGHKRGVEGISLHGFHRIPGDLLLAVIVLVGSLNLSVSGEELFYRHSYISMNGQLLCAGALTACTAILALALLVTFAARCKAHTVWRNTVIWRLCRLIYRICRGVAAAVPLAWKPVLGGVVYLLLSAYLWSRFFYYYSGGWILLWVLLTAAVIAYLCLWAYQWKRIRRGAHEIISGHPEHQINTQGMLPDLKAHADELNNLGQAISAAVDEQMKSERFKAELITNVSHDLKTPLTSIINYVDLLKKEDIPNPTAREYIDVLDRKSQRLKKLTEDLVEASKASTGALTVNKEQLDVAQLVRQAVGEYEEKLTAAGLTLVTDLPEEKVTICADGRHLWRVLDNLLGNCAKYALEGTRVYLDVAAESGSVVITVKNISRQPLNVPVEQLMERFVRGDESRTTEGSGLGLSIARSLTELQGGRFSLTVDGDLFKATVTFPLV